MKTTTYFGVALILPFLAWPMAARAQFFDYSVNADGKTVTITDYTGLNSALVIPTNILGRTVTGIGASAFGLAAAYDPGLSSISIPNSVTNIGEDAFANCFNLKTITVAADNPAYSSFNGVLFDKLQTALLDCPRGRSGNFTIPGSVTNIGVDAFLYCQSVSNILLPDSVTTISDGAFIGCSPSQVVLGSNVMAIGSAVWFSCGNLTNFTVDAHNQFYSSVGGVLFDKNQTVLLQYPIGLAGHYDIPDGVASIGNSAFDSCDSLTSVTMPDSLDLIGENAFTDCNSLTNVGWSPDLTSIGDGAFRYCFGLTGVLLPDSLNYIGSFAFDSCSLTNITVGGGVTNIEDGAFEENYSLTNATMGRSVAHFGTLVFGSCTNLVNITIDPLNPFYSSVDGVVFDHTQATLLEFPSGRGGSYQIPNNVTNIGDGAFEDCADLASVTLPAGITNIGEEAFWGCASLRYVIFLGNPPAAGAEDAFVYGYNQTTMYYLADAVGWGATFDYFPTSLWDPQTEFGYAITNGAISVNSSTALGGPLIIPASMASLPVTSIGDNAFADGAFTSVAIPDSVTNIGGSAFANCVNLSSVTIGHAVTTIGFFAFGNSGLTNVTIPDSVRDIEQGAFFECGGLATATIGSGVTNIEVDAFLACPSLASVYFLGNAPAVGNDFFTIDGNSYRFTLHGSFAGDDQAIVYYQPATTGWGVNYGGLPALRWNGSVHFGATADGWEYVSDNVESVITGYAGQSNVVTVPDRIDGATVDSIGQNVFADSDIASVTIPSTVTHLGNFAFEYCVDLTNVFFGGNAPAVGLWAFAYDQNATAYYLPGTTGWNGPPSAPALATALWLLPEPLILGASVGVRSNQFSFTVSWATNTPVVVEACANLAAPVWQPLSTNTLTNGVIYFSDPNWTNYSARYYRLRSP
ncbi:MAG TPA: leucine-rich repeat protein [Verrucomicrobiae bacterium]|jgi:hypothetical protein|nr:leucine-rich repeat protein [Verrucomicrobiae bacterium]